MKKQIYFDKRAEKEYSKLPKIVQNAFDILLNELARFGSLEEPNGKKVKGTDLFEIRIRLEGAWRSLYAYYLNNDVLILSFFQKKTQKTPQQEINKAIKRLNNLKN